VRWGFFRVVGIAAHPELAALDPHYLACQMPKSGAIIAARYSQVEIFLCFALSCWQRFARA
jgi:hypothetical protein